jgi:hypothetical protein
MKQLLLGTYIICRIYCFCFIGTQIILKYLLGYKGLICTQANKSETSSCGVNAASCNTFRYIFITSNRISVRSMTLSVCCKTACVFQIAILNKRESVYRTPIFGHWKRPGTVFLPHSMSTIYLLNIYFNITLPFSSWSFKFLVSLNTSCFSHYRTTYCNVTILLMSHTMQGLCFRVI